MYDYLSDLSDAFSEFVDLFFDYFKEVHLCLNLRLSDLFAVTIPIVKLAKLSRLHVSIARIPWMRKLIRLVRLKVLARMYFSSAGLLMISALGINFGLSITGLVLV